MGKLWEVFTGDTRKGLLEDDARVVGEVVVARVSVWDVVAASTTLAEGRLHRRCRFTGSAGQ